MRVEVGYSDNPNTFAAGQEAAKEALRRKHVAALCPGRTDSSAGAHPPALAPDKKNCDLVLLFSTSSHDPAALREGVASIVGEDVPIVGGGATGAISNERFGYAGDQIILALFWMDENKVDFLTETGLHLGEEEAGNRLGKRLAALGAGPHTPLMLFYDAADHSRGCMRMVMGTYLLSGIKKGLGFLPDITGAGMLGDFLCSPSMQWNGSGISQYSALALMFGAGVRIDNIIMHGCRPATGYYTITKTDQQTILEINGKPALEFMNELMGGAIAPESYPFFLTFGVNKADKWGEFDEDCYANRMCLGLDQERGGLVMFEPDLTPGTEFQIMYRNLNLDYIPPKIEKLFDNLHGRKPVFAMYINCAGRAAGYGGVDIEDAIAVQNCVAGRVPLLGIYTGVEIAPVAGVPCGLDLTGVFCLFSVPK